MVNILEQGIRNLETMGILDVALPFILIFTVIWAILEKIQVFGEDNPSGRKVHTAIAFVIGLVPVFQHILAGSPSGPNCNTVVCIINTSLGPVAAIAIAILMVLILLGIGGFTDPFKKSPGMKNAAMILTIGSVIFIFGSSAGFNWWRLPYGITSDIATIVVAILVFGGVIWFVTGDGGKTVREIKKSDWEDMSTADKRSAEKGNKIKLVD